MMISQDWQNHGQHGIDLQAVKEVESDFQGTALRDAFLDMDLYKVLTAVPISKYDEARLSLTLLVLES